MCTSKPCCDFHIRDAKGEPHPDFKQLIEASKPPTPVATGNSKQSTVEITEMLFGEGLTAKEIAVKRGIVINTVYVHAADLIGNGRLDLRRVVNEDIEQEIRRAIETVGSMDKLAPVKTKLPDRIDFGEIRCVIAHIKHNELPPPAPEVETAPDAAATPEPPVVDA